MIKACIFDLDGTLSNTLDTISYYGNKALSDFGLPEIEKERYKYLVGTGYIKLIENMFAEIGCTDRDLFDKVAKRYDDMYSADVMYLTKAYDGVAEALDALKAKGMKIGVVTNKPHEIAKGVVKQLFPNIEFDSLEGGRPDVPLKPAPAMLMKMLVDFGISYRECAYFGDTKVDMTVGSRAEVNTVGVLWGFRDEAELLENGAQFIISKPSEIVPLVERMEAML